MLFAAPHGWKAMPVTFHILHECHFPLAVWADLAVHSVSSLSVPVNPKRRHESVVAAMNALLQILAGEFRLRLSVPQYLYKPSHF